jgi:hypothetical protein
MNLKKKRTKMKERERERELESSLTFTWTVKAIPFLLVYLVINDWLNFLKKMKVIICWIVTNVGTIVRFSRKKKLKGKERKKRIQTDRVEFLKQILAVQNRASVSLFSLHTIKPIQSIFLISSPQKTVASTASKSAVSWLHPDR